MLPIVRLAASWAFVRLPPGSVQAAAAAGPDELNPSRGTGHWQLERLIGAATSAFVSPTSCMPSGSTPTSQVPLPVHTSQKAGTGHCVAVAQCREWLIQPRQ